MERLEQKHAEALSGELAAEGYETAVVSHDELFSLPHAPNCNRLVPGDEGLMLHDMYGQQRTVAWASVLVVCAGIVDETNYERSLVLEMLFDVEPQRLHIDAQRFNFSYLGRRKSHDRGANFALLVRDIVASAKLAVVNASAKAMAAGEGSVQLYTTSHAFKEEMVWCVWRAMRASGQAGRG
jgi:hypothetical protein